MVLIILLSPSSRGRGLKFPRPRELYAQYRVALFTRAWIEIQAEMEALDSVPVALFTRAWIEIIFFDEIQPENNVALFTRAWIEILTP